MDVGTSGHHLEGGVVGVNGHGTRIRSLASGHACGWARVHACVWLPVGLRVRPCAHMHTGPLCTCSGAGGVLVAGGVLRTQTSHWHHGSPFPSIHLEVLIVTSESAGSAARVALGAKAPCEL